MGNKKRKRGLLFGGTTPGEGGQRQQDQKKKGKGKNKRMKQDEPAHDEQGAPHNKGQPQGNKRKKGKAQKNGGVGGTRKGDKAGGPPEKRGLLNLRLYKQAAYALQQVLQADATQRNGRSLKSLTLRSGNACKKATHALTCEALKYLSVVQEILELAGPIELSAKSKLWTEMVYVAVYDLLFGQKHMLESAAAEPTIGAVLARRAALQAALARVMVKRGVASVELLLPEEAQEDLQYPRYARVNTLKATTPDIINEFEQEHQRRCKQRQQQQPQQSQPQQQQHQQHQRRQGQQQQQQQQQAQELAQAADALEAFVFRDPDVRDLLRFPPGTDLHSHPRVLDGSIILQGKASCMPALVLAPDPHGHTDVLDACAAPGNKTTHLAALMGGRGTLWACERDAARAQLLRTTIARAGADNVTVLETDFMALDPTSAQLSKVSGVLVDPSCSGSGTAAMRMDYFLPSRAKGAMARRAAAEERLERLGQFQEAILRHALAFPAAERVVYSTCSIEERENEAVVAAVLKQATELGFRLAPALPNWSRRGLSHYEFGSLVVRTDPRKDATEGFFVALFERKAAAQQ